jgi:hypothetical protein
MTRDEALRRFWSASRLHRQAPERSREIVMRVLSEVAIHSTGLLHQRADELLEEVISNEPARTDATAG